MVFPVPIELCEKMWHQNDLDQLSLDIVSVPYLQAKQKFCNKKVKHNTTLIFLLKSDMVRMITQVPWEN